MRRREFHQAVTSRICCAHRRFLSSARAEATPKEIRIGTQKGGFFPSVRQRHSLEDVFQPLGIEVKWIDFQFGPPLLEALNVGSVDFGYVGDTPPIFAQAAGARIGLSAADVSRRAARRGDHRAAGLPDQIGCGPEGQAIALRQGIERALSPGRGAREGRPRLQRDPARVSGAGRCVRGLHERSVDAWSIWDPYLAAAEASTRTRASSPSTGTCISANHQFYFSAEDFRAETKPSARWLASMSSPR